MSKDLDQALLLLVQAEVLAAAKRPGPSAYDVWLAAGNTGDEAAFLASLVGERGADGLSAYAVWLAAGNAGDEAAFLASLIGARGADGRSAYDLWLAAGNTGDEADFLASLIGAAGKKGDKGERGEKGERGKDGKDGRDGKPGIVWRGPWKRGEYAKNDAVEHLGSSYIATAPTSNRPPAAPWDLLAQRGADGFSGAIGGSSSGDGGSSDEAVAAHIAAADPHPQYTTAAEAAAADAAVQSAAATDATTKANAVRDGLLDGVGSDGDTLAKLRALIAGIQTLLTSDNINLDTLQEVVDFIEVHQSSLDSLGTGKVNVADIINGLTDTSSNKPLSAAQGKVLKDLLDALTTVVAGKEASISAGTTAQYWRGDKAWRDFATDVRGTVLAGLSTASATVVTAAHSVLEAIGFIQAQISGYKDAALAFTQKTIALGSNTISGTKSQFDAAVTDDNFAYLGQAQTFTAKQTINNDLEISGTARRITGDLSSSTASNRILFQSTTANGFSNVGVVPNGTSSSAAINVINNSNPDNAAYGSIQINASAVIYQSGINGAGTYLPMVFYTNGAERMRIDTSGNVLVTSPATLGYGTGAGGTVTQPNSKTDPVTLNKPCGVITMNNASLASGAAAPFVFNNSVVKANSVVACSFGTSAGAVEFYSVITRVVGDGEVHIALRNNHTAALAEAVQINFVVINGRAS